MEDKKYTSKTMEMLEKKGDSIYKPKYSSFQEELKKDIEQIKSQRDKDIQKDKGKERYNEPKQEKSHKTTQESARRHIDNCGCR